MKQIMISTFSGVLIAAISYGIYCYVRNNKFNLIKVVLTVYLCLSFLPLINLLRNEEVDIIGVVVQFLTIILVFCIVFSIYKKDIQFDTLYRNISSIKIKPIIVIGLSDIDLNDIEYFNGKIENIKSVFCRLKKKYFSYIRYTDGILEISLIITDIPDFKELCSLENKNENISIKNVEPSPKGGALTLVIQK